MLIVWWWYSTPHFKHSLSLTIWKQKYSSLACLQKHFQDKLLCLQLVQWTPALLETTSCWILFPQHAVAETAWRSLALGGFLNAHPSCCFPPLALSVRLWTWVPRGPDRHFVYRIMHHCVAWQISSRRRLLLMTHMKYEGIVWARIPAWCYDGEASCLLSSRVACHGDDERLPPSDRRADAALPPTDSLLLLLLQSVFTSPLLNVPQHSILKLRMTTLSCLSPSADLCDASDMITAGTRASKNQHATQQRTGSTQLQMGASCARQETALGSLAVIFHFGREQRLSSLHLRRMHPPSGGL